MMPATNLRFATPFAILKRDLKLLARWLSAAGLAMGFAACSGPPVDPPPVTGLPRVMGKDQGYTRTIQSEPDTFAIQTGSRLFRRAGSPDIDLVGAIHVAEKDYYWRLQARLEKSDIVLYEGVGKKDDSAPEVEVNKTAYGRLASSLGLVVQKPGIDYSRPNFRRCDLTVEEMEGLLEKEIAGGGSSAIAAREARDELADIGTAMHGRRWTLNAALGIVRLSPALQEHLRLSLAGVGSDAREDESTISPRLDQLIKEDRNRHVVAELQKLLRRERGHRRVAIFYGSAHMPDLERRLKAMGYSPAGPVTWESAVHAHPYAAGISADEVKEALGG